MWSVTDQNIIMWCMAVIQLKPIHNIKEKGFQAPISSNYCQSDFGLPYPHPGSKLNDGQHIGNYFLSNRAGTGGHLLGPAAGFHPDPTG